MTAKLVFLHILLIFFVFCIFFVNVYVWKILTCCTLQVYFWPFKISFRNQKMFICTSVMLKITHTVEIHRQNHVKAHTHTLSQSHTLPPRLWDGLFSHRHADYFGTLIYSAVIVVFSHFLFSSGALIYLTCFYLPVNAGSIQTSCSHPLRSKQKRTSHYEGWPTINTQINMWLAYFDCIYMDNYIHTNCNTGIYPYIIHMFVSAVMCIRVSRRNKKAQFSVFNMLSC